tara:strand:+ start:102321 stop:103124 length:804 start_codon:yes stop_codon:yes gene_type:complete
MRVSEKQLSKICQHLGIAVSGEINRAFTPREIDRIQHFVDRKRAADKKSKSTPGQKALAPTVQAAPVKSTTVKSEPVKSEPVKPELAPSPPKVVARLPAVKTAPVKTATVKTPAVKIVAVDTAAMETASVGLRVCAYIIDCLVTFVLTPFIFIPILGQVMIGVFLFFYWLLRDVGGASPGKLILGMQVGNNTGDPFRVGPRIMRNILLSIGPMLFCIPIVGFLIGAPIALLIILLEVVMLLATGKRIGDRLGGTSVKTIPKVRLVSE